MGCVVYSLTRAISVSADDEHIKCEHTNFLLCCLPLSDWLSLPSQWQRLCVFEVVASVYLCVCAHARGPECWGVSACLSSEIIDKNILFPVERNRSVSFPNDLTQPTSKEKTYKNTTAAASQLSFRWEIYNCFFFTYITNLTFLSVALGRLGHFYTDLFSVSFVSPTAENMKFAC